MNIVNIAYRNEIDTILQKKSGIEFKQKNLSNLEKNLVEKNCELAYEYGTVFLVGRNKMVYLFKYKAAYYGVDLLMYKIRPKAMPIFDIEKRPIVEILPPEKVLKIVDFLNSNNVHPLEQISNLYDQLRSIIYN